jgi:hypothetical protein
MSYFIRITRTPDEEPYYLHLLLEISNGRQRASLEIYLRSASLLDLAEALQAFPRNATDVFEFEVGTEKPEDRLAYYFGFRAFVLDKLGHSALWFRLNNNRELPHRELAEFCIEAEVANINRLGGLLHSFSKLQHRSLFWSLDESSLA